MFYSGKEKVRLEAKFFELQNQIFDLRNRIELLEQRPPYGIKKDGTPKKKPGRRPAKSFTVNVK